MTACLVPDRWAGTSNEVIGLDLDLAPRPRSHHDRQRSWWLNRSHSAEWD